MFARDFFWGRVWVIAAMATLLKEAFQLAFPLLLTHGLCVYLRSVPSDVATLLSLLATMSSSQYAYLTRIIPALSVLGVVALLFVSLVLDPYRKIERGDQHAHSTTSQLILSLYTILLHISSVLFPARLCWAIGDVTKRMKEKASLKDDPKTWKTLGVKKAQDNIAYPSPLFVVIIPAYKEAVETLEETLRVLASHPRARHAYHVRWLLC